MAKIPTGNFGNMVAQGSPGARLNPAAFDTGSGLADAGQSFMRIAASEVYQQRQEQKQMDYEREQLIREAASKEEKFQNELKTLKLADKLKTSQDQITAVADSLTGDVEMGVLKYNDVPSVFNKAIEKLGLPDLQGFDEVQAARFTSGYNDTIRNAQLRLGGVIKKGQIADYKATTDSNIDSIAKGAGLPGADMTSITKQLNAMDTYGTQAYGAAWGKKKQDTLDSMWYAHLNQQSMAVGSNLQGIRQLKKEITTGVYADKLDSNRRNTLVAKLDGLETGLIQRNEAAAQRVQRQQEKRMNDARSAFETYQTLADKGLYLSPEYVNQVTQQTAGTPYQQGVIALNKQAQETGGLAAQPITAQKQALTQIDSEIALKGRSPELDKRREQVSKVLTASQSDLQNNGMRAGLARGVITNIEPLDMSSPEAMQASISKRVKDAEVVSMWAGGKPVSPLDSDEAANQVRPFLEALPAKERSQAIATIASTVGPKQAGAIAQQLDKQNRALGLAFASGSSKTTLGRYASELILGGDQDLKDGLVMKDDTKVTGTRAMIAKEVDGLLPSEQFASQVKDSAYLISARLGKENGGNITPKIVKKAVQLSIHGDIIEHNGKRLPIPAGIDEDAFKTRINNVTADELRKQTSDGNVRVGGVLMNVSDFAQSVPGQELVPAGYGQYTVVVSGRAVTNTRNQPIVIKVNQ